MKLQLDSTLCQGYGLCHERAPELVGIDEWGYAHLIAATVPGTAADEAAEAVTSCPNAALRLVK